MFERPFEPISAVRGSNAAITPPRSAAVDAPGGSVGAAVGPVWAASVRAPRRESRESQSRIAPYRPATAAAACPRQSVRLWVASAQSLSTHATRQLRDCSRPLAGRYANIVRVWREADTVPELEHAWLYDHLMPIASDHLGPIFEGWTLLSALAAQTSRRRLLPAGHEQPDSPACGGGQDCRHRRRRLRRPAWNSASGPARGRAFRRAAASTTRTARPTSTFALARRPGGGVHRDQAPVDRDRAV